jgi:hypothetical protein
MRKTLLLTVALSLNGCGTPLPEPPPVWQCAYSIKFDKFRCVNTETKQAINLPRSAAIMEGAQCLNADDYRKQAAWVDTLIQIARTHCK